jgi:hypothetical protein
MWDPFKTSQLSVSNVDALNTPSEMCHKFVLYQSIETKRVTFDSHFEKQSKMV